jgi:tRNA threonylcarbamoyladenosine biosynthesis protein TsaB
VAHASRPHLVLGIETATALGGVALVAPEGLLAEQTLRSVESHSERILPAAEGLLRALGATVRDLAAVAVSSGPGSFTGLRTGVASAQGLAFALGVPLYGVPTLAALAAGAPPGEGVVCAVLNARRGELFRCLFRVEPGGPVPLGAEESVPLERFTAGLPPGCLVLGEPPPALRAPGAAALAGLRLAPAHLNHPRAAAVAFSGLGRLRAGDPGDPADLRPRYLRPSDAESAAASAPTRARG